MFSLWIVYCCLLLHGLSTSPAAKAELLSYGKWTDALNFPQTINNAVRADGSAYFACQGKRLPAVDPLLSWWRERCFDDIREEPRKPRVCNSSAVCCYKVCVLQRLEWLSGDFKYERSKAHGYISKEYEKLGYPLRIIEDLIDEYDNCVYWYEQQDNEGCAKNSAFVKCQAQVLLTVCDRDDPDAHLLPHPGNNDLFQQPKAPIVPPSPQGRAAAALTTEPETPLLTPLTLPTHTDEDKTTIKDVLHTLLSKLDSGKREQTLKYLTEAFNNPATPAAVPSVKPFGRSIYRDYIFKNYPKFEVLKSDTTTRKPKFPLPQEENTKPGGLGGFTPMEKKDEAEVTTVPVSPTRYADDDSSSLSSAVHLGRAALTHLGGSSSTNMDKILGSLDLDNAVRNISDSNKKDDEDESKKSFHIPPEKPLTGPFSDLHNVTLVSSPAESFGSNSSSRNQGQGYEGLPQGDEPFEKCVKSCKGLCLGRTKFE